MIREIEESVEETSVDTACAADIESATMKVENVSTDINDPKNELDTATVTRKVRNEELRIVSP